jgi:DNA polymerase-3 subunit delta
MSADTIIASWKKKSFQPIYWLEGEEPYYIDSLIRYAEQHILSESEASFNLTVFYGKDADWTAIINACKRYPMFAEKQVVILKEAQQMNGLEKLEPYMEDPLASTIFIVGYKGKGVDKRTKLYKTLSKKAEVFNSVKIKDDKIYDWILQQIKLKGLTATSKAISLIEEHVGNDLSRIETEIEKLSINLTHKKEIDEDDIEKYIGISKEYNIFELQAAIAKKDLAKAIQIIAYFESNPKAVPIQMALPALYSFFSKVYQAYGMKDQSDNALLPVFYRNFYSLKQAKETMRNYGYTGVERIILLMNHYNLKSVGVGDAGTGSASLMREMVVKMML